MTAAPVVNGAFVWMLLLLVLHLDDPVDHLKDAMRGLAVPLIEQVIIAPIDISYATYIFLYRLEQADKINLEILALPRQPASTMSHVTRRSRRLQGLQPELSTVLAFPARKKMEREENRPFCHRWRDPTVFSGERGEDSQRWLSDFQRVARYNKWYNSMCLANVIFYLTGTAKCWFENFEEILNSWEEFKIKFCEIFENKEDTARKAENILRTRAQTSGENIESYIQEVLLLCKQSNPRMSEGEKVSHLIKGVAEEVYQALVGKDINTVDQFVAFCRRFEAFKRMRVAPPRFNRLPNVTTISTAEPENLEALIRRIVREEVQKFMAPPSTFAAQDIDTSPPDLRYVIRSEIQQTLAPISAPRQPESFRPRRQYLPQNDQGYRRRTDGPPNNQRTQWRTEDDRPICFHCGRPGHVARYCRDRRQAFADARLGRETVDFGRPRTENYTMGESGSELSQGRFRNPSPYPHRGRFQAPRRTSQSPARRPSRSPSRRTATMEKNWISVNIQGRNVQALVDSGADYSVISEAFRRSIKAPVFEENGPLLRAADKKPIVTLGKCSLEVQIKGLDIIFDFVVAAECSHDVILGWDFFRATDAIIDCGKNKLYLSEAERSYEWKDLKLCAALDCVIPPKSFGKIVVTNQDVFGSRDVVVTGSKRLQLEKGLFIPSSLVRFLHGRAVMWVTNSTHQSQVIPSDMKVGTMQDLEVGSISNLDACSEIAGKDEVTSPDVRECLISMISTDLEETKKNRLLTCLNEFSDIFDFEKKSFPVSGEIKHKIDTSDYPPVRQRPYRVSPAERRVIQSEVEKMMGAKIIRPSSSPWASPVILVKKKDGSLRFCVDYRRLNKITKKDVYPLPRIDDALKTLSGSRYFSTMDMRSGYWQIEVDDKDREKTAFITPDGLYEFNVMPFGLCNAPATFERIIDNVLRGLKWDMCLCYLDDIVVYGSTFKEHLTRLYKVLRFIQQAGLCLNYKKCHFASRQITILGHVVNEFGTQPDPEKVKAIVHFPKPRNISDTRSFLGLSSYYRRFIKSYANKSRPLNSLLKKDEKLIWGEEQNESFRILKQELGSSPVLGHFVEGAETHVHTDASGYGLGAVLVQIQNDAERPIAYASRTLTKAEKNYSTTEKECLAVVWALGKFRPYLYGRPFTVVTDHHSLCWLVGLKDPYGLSARWALKLQEYDINIVYKSGRKHKDAYCLSRSPLADTAEIEGHITSIQDIAEEQSKDPHLVGIREKLANENLKGYQMIGGVLYKKNYDPEGKPWLLVVPKQMRHEILKDVHDTPMAGHLGFAKTYDRAAATAEATELATFLIEDVILKHGAPREIITDRGRNFMSQTIREINNLNGTIHRFTTAYHPQTNGLTERLNKTLTDMISMYVDVDQKNWDSILPYVTFAYNTSRQETTGCSPFFLVHGREVETPLDSILPYQPAGTAEDYVGHLVTNAEDARMLARLNILQAQSKDKERYDKKHQEVTYKEGDLVWVLTPVRTVGLSEKLLKRYFGPYRVIRKISSVNYQVEGVTNTRRRRKTQDIVHVVRMKPYHDPEVQEQIAQVVSEEGLDKLAEMADKIQEMNPRLQVYESKNKDPTFEEMTATIASLIEEIATLKLENRTRQNWRSNSPRPRQRSRSRSRNGADVSLIPFQVNGTPTEDIQLYAANGSLIPTYGFQILDVDLGQRRNFKWRFITARVYKGILGADFLKEHTLLIDLKNRQLVDGCTNLKIRGAVTSMSCGISTLDKNSKFYNIIYSFPNITIPNLLRPKVQHNVRHFIATKGPPVFARARPLNSMLLKIAEKEFQYMLDNHIIRPSRSPWASPLHMVRKKEGSWRPCGDYRKLNSVTIPDRYPIPKLEDFNHILKKTRYYSKIDLFKAYYQIPINEEDREKTAVITPFGLFEFEVMSFGLCGAPATFQRFINQVLWGLDFVFPYLDDILVASKSEEEHESHLRAVFSRLDQYGLPQMVFGKTIRLPGEFFQDSQQSIDRDDLIKNLQKDMSSLQPMKSRINRNPNVFIHKDLQSCSHVFIRKDRVEKPLEPAYEGPFKVLKSTVKYFTVMVEGKEDNVSLDRLKPTYLLKESFMKMMTGASNQGSSRTCDLPRPVPRESILRNPKGLVV
ncbi:hypothetical protein LAZ67_4002838, partial [Cordylochernes scorpioides]